MSPEQIENNEVDARSDVYSLGCVLYEMIVGRAAVRRGTDDVQVLYQQMHVTPPTARRFVPDAPPELDAAHGQGAGQGSGSARFQSMQRDGRGASPTRAAQDLSRDTGEAMTAQGRATRSRIGRSRSGWSTRVELAGGGGAARHRRRRRRLRVFADEQAGAVKVEGGAILVVTRSRRARRSTSTAARSPRRRRRWCRDCRRRRARGEAQAGQARHRRAVR